MLKLLLSPLDEIGAFLLLKKKKNMNNLELYKINKKLFNINKNKSLKFNIEAKVLQLNYGYTANHSAIYDYVDEDYKDIISIPAFTFYENINYDNDEDDILIYKHIPLIYNLSIDNLYYLINEQPCILNIKGLFTTGQQPPLPPSQTPFYKPGYLGLFNQSFDLFLPITTIHSNVSGYFQTIKNTIFLKDIFNTYYNNDYSYIYIINAQHNVTLFQYVILAVKINCDNYNYIDIYNKINDINYINIHYNKIKHINNFLYLIDFENFTYTTKKLNIITQQKPSEIQKIITIKNIKSKNILFPIKLYSDYNVNLEINFNY